MALHKDQQQKLPTLQMKVNHSKNTANSSNTCPSFRVYYGGVSVAIPFVWESKPGTPKHHQSSDHRYSNSPPPSPLTPPPSYFRQSPPDSTTTNNNLMIMKSTRPNKSTSSLLPEFCKKLITINRHRSKHHRDRKTTPSTRRSFLGTVYDLRVDDDVKVTNSHTLCFWR